MQEGTQQPKVAAQIHDMSARVFREKLLCGGSEMPDERFGSIGSLDPDHGRVLLAQLHLEPQSLERVPEYPHLGQF
jgi:hypothetical protein